MGFQVIFNFLIILCCIQTTFALQDIKFDYITPDNGLSQSSVTCILQDKYGYMWFGTMNGLNKYNGYTFEKYYTNLNDTNSLAGNLISAIYEDKKGNLWIGTDNGLSLYNRDRDSFKNFRQNKNDPNSLWGKIISCLVEDNKSQLWVGSIDGGLNLLDRESRKCKHFIHDEHDPYSISTNAVYSLIVDKYGTLWIATEGGGLCLYDPSTDKFSCFKKELNKTDGLNNNTIYALAEDDSGTIWIGTMGNGISRINRNPDGHYSFRSFTPKTSDSSRLRVLSLLADKAHGLWIGTENGGLDYFDIKRSIFYNYYQDDDIPNSLNSNSIHSIYKDNSGNIWIGTYTGGINILKKNRKKINTYRKIPGNNNSLSYNAVSCFFEDVDGVIWIGTDGGGLNRWDRRADIITHFNSRNSCIKSDAILAICKDNENDIWIGGWGCGLNVYKKSSHTLVCIPPGKDGIPGNNISYLAVDKKDQIWISYGGVGFAKYNKKSKTCKVYTMSNSILPNRWVHELIIDNKGDIIITHLLGFSIFHPENETIVNYSHIENDENSLSNDQVNVILQTFDSTFWIGTINGLNHFAPKENKFTRYFEQNGLPSNNITGLVEDNSGFLWISTSCGISKFDRKSGNFRNFTVADGLQGNSFIKNSCYKTSKGEILFGGTNGFNLFLPDSLQDNPYIPPIVLTDFRIFNTPVKPGVKGSSLRQHISQTHNIVLSYRQSVISFDFAALDYTAPAQNHYAYAMEGFDKKWNFVGTLHTATYTNLDPGDYTFRVIGSNNDNKWNEEGASVEIKITPPYWKTWWFRFACFLIILFMISMYVNIRTKFIRKNNQLLEALVEERTKQINIKNNLLMKRTNDLNETNVLLEERQEQIEEQTEELLVQKEELTRINDELNQLNATKDKFFSIIAHDIKNPFNTILGFAELLKANFKKWTEEKKLKTVNVLYDTSRNLYALLENLLQWSRSQRGAIEFEPEMSNLKEQIESMFTLLKDSADEKQIKLEIDMPDEGLMVYSDIHMLHTIIRNLLSNAIKFTFPGGTIKIAVERNDKYLTIKVIDNGVGMTQDVLDMLFRIDSHYTTSGTNNERGTGLGLILCKEFITKHGGEIHAESHEGHGSTFIFTLPYGPPL